MVALGNRSHHHVIIDCRDLSFLPLFFQYSKHSEYMPTLRRAMWGLLAMVLLFDLYTVYQQLQIHRMRRRLFEREELFRLISDNAADMIAVVDMNGNRIYNSQSYDEFSDMRKRAEEFFRVHHFHDDDRHRSGKQQRRLDGQALARQLHIGFDIKTGTGAFLNRPPV